ncbi:hypothetical protein GEMRC1_007125 [Eukaryota sp. GEM-RC1]
MTVTSTVSQNLVITIKSPSYVVSDYSQPIVLQSHQSQKVTFMIAEKPIESQSDILVSAQVLSSGISFEKTIPLIINNYHSVENLHPENPSKSQSLKVLETNPELTRNIQKLQSQKAEFAAFTESKMKEKKENPPLNQVKSFESIPKEEPIYIPSSSDTYSLPRTADLNPIQSNPSSDLISKSEEFVSVEDNHHAKSRSDRSESSKVSDNQGDLDLFRNRHSRSASLQTDEISSFGSQSNLIGGTLTDTSPEFSSNRAPSIENLSIQHIFSSVEDSPPVPRVKPSRLDFDPSELIDLMYSPQIYVKPGFVSCMPLVLTSKTSHDVKFSIKSTTPSESKSILIDKRVGILTPSSSSVLSLSCNQTASSKSFSVFVDGCSKPDQISLEVINVVGSFLNQN